MYRSLTSEVTVFFTITKILEFQDDRYIGLKLKKIDFFMRSIDTEMNKLLLF